MEEIRALIIDDEEELVTTLAERLAIRGVQAEYCTTAKQALLILADKPFDVVVLDIKLPGVRGLELLRTIKAAHPNLKVLLFTGQGGIEEELEQSQVVPLPRADGLLLKPVNIDVLVEKLKAAVGR